MTLRAMAITEVLVTMKLAVHSKKGFIHSITRLSMICFRSKIYNTLAINSFKIRGSEPKSYCI